MKRFGLVVLGLGVLAGGACTADLAEMAEGLYVPLKFVTVMFRYACYATGFALCMGAIAQYRLHRQNPKLTPLLTPVILLFLGVVLIFLPYFSTMFGNSWSAEDQDARGLVGGAVEEGANPVRRPGTASGSTSGASSYWGDEH